MPDFFYKHFRDLNFYITLSGIFIDGFPSKYKIFDALFLLYHAFTAILSFTQIIFCFVVLYDYETNKNFVHTASIFSIYITGFIFNMFVMLNQKRFKMTIDKLNKLIDLLMTNKIIGGNDYEIYLIENCKIIKKVWKTDFTTVIAAITINNSNKLFQSWCLFGMDGKKNLNYQTPYDSTYSPMYELTILVQSFGLFVAVTQLFGVNFLFVTFFQIILTSFSFLQNKIASIVVHNFSLVQNYSSSHFKTVSQNNHEKMDCLLNITTGNFHNDVNEDTRTSKKFNFFNCNFSSLNNDNSDKVLKTWARTHQELLLVCKEIIELYSPLLAVYFIYIYVTVAFTIFSAIQNTHSHTFIEVIVLAYFTLLTLINFYILCAYGNHLMTESKNLSWAVYASPWYNSSQEHKSLIRMVLRRSARPVIVKCFGSTSFDLTNSTFIVILKSIVSFYLGLVQMKKQ